MIGVLASDDERPWIAEFFELFKTPWEIAQPGRRYRVVLSTDGRTPETPDGLVLMYGAREYEIDRSAGVGITLRAAPVEGSWDRSPLPLYAGAASFSGSGLRESMTTAEGAPLEYRRQANGRVVRRIGYDLAAEVRHLLQEGQPASRASQPTLEHHIAWLRRCLEAEGVAYVEVPPRPDGYGFICCLTHDIDFFGLRRHIADRTLLGFLLRGTFGTLVDLVRGVRPFAEALRNWTAVLSAPFVFAGLATDPWQPFRDFATADGPRNATFFVVPFKRTPGLGPDGRAHAARAVPYGVDDIRDEIVEASGPTTEIAVHGIDAWRDAAAGAKELEAVRSVTGRRATGVRMHWLYFSAASGRELEQAGFDYDSTWGYNDAVGFRAGTLQAFRLAEGGAMLELPLSIMDTALFYPSRMGLDCAEGMARCRAIVEEACRFGGALVINWHDRSLAPERLWVRPYRMLVAEIEARQAWFATAGHTVDWFRWRRAIRFQVDEPFTTVVVSAPDRDERLPGATVVVHRPHDHGVSSDHRPFAGSSVTVQL